MKSDIMDKKMQSISHNVPDERPEPLGSDSYTKPTRPRTPPPQPPFNGYGNDGTVYPDKRKRKPTQHMKQALHAFRFLVLILAIPLQFVALHMLGTIESTLVGDYIVIVIIVPGAICYLLFSLGIR